MTEEEKRAYRREWNRKNKEKLRQYRLNYIRRKALEELKKKNGQNATA